MELMNEVNPFEFSDNKNFLRGINFRQEVILFENGRCGSQKLPVTGVMDRKFMGPISS